MQDGLENFSQDALAMYDKWDLYKFKVCLSIDIDKYLHPLRKKLLYDKFTHSSLDTCSEYDSYVWKRYIKVAVFMP